MSKRLAHLVRPLIASSFVLGAISLPMLGGCVVVMGGCDWDGATVERIHTTSVPHVAGAGLDVEGDNGKIVVRRGGTSEVAIKATIRAKTQERADAVRIEAGRSSAGSGRSAENALVVRAKWPEDKRLGS